MKTRKRFWSFHWDQRFDGLSDERMEEIRDWLDSLSDADFKCVEDLAQDARKQQEFDASEYNE